MQKYIPLQKRSKKLQKEHHKAQRAGWGEISPVTRVSKKKNKYDRKIRKALDRREMNMD